MPDARKHGVFAGFIRRYMGGGLDFRVRAFNVLAMAGCIVSLAVTIVAIIVGEGIPSILFNLLSGVLAFSLLIYAGRTGKYQLCSGITIVVIFGGFFTYLFFLNGGLLGAVPYYFVFAVVFTIFMIGGARSLILAGVEILYYTGLCVFAYQHPELVRDFSDERTALIDSLLGMITVAIALGVTMYVQLRMYREQQARLAEQNVALGQINRLKTEFLGNISHELRTPLTVVSAHAQYGAQSLEGHPEQAEVIKRMRLIGSETDRMAMMVSQILDISRIEEGQMPIDSKGESILEIIQWTLEVYYPMFVKNGNRLLFRPEGNMPYVWCDRNRIMQVLVNLISNASRHTRDGEIRICVGREGEMAYVSVSDNGDGIEPDRLVTLFERYNGGVELASRREGGGGGTGLGLFICRHIIQGHGGQITAESRSGYGTTIRFTLPIMDMPPTA